MYGVDYLVGLDIGKQQDYTVLSILELKLYDIIPKYTLKHIVRYPLRTDYIYIVDNVCKQLDDERLNGKCSLVLDHSGVGSPVYELFRNNLTNTTPIGVTITGGNNTHWRDNSNAIVSKTDIVSSLQVVMQNGRLIIPSNIPLLKEIEKEFLNFKAKIGKTATTFEASGGVHDDIVMSISIALWYGEYVNRKGRGTRMVGGI
jgi:hypothetical protein